MPELSPIDPSLTTSGASCKSAAKTCFIQKMYEPLRREIVAKPFTLVINCDRFWINCGCDEKKSTCQSTNSVATVKDGAPFWPAS